MATNLRLSNKATYELCVAVCEVKRNLNQIYTEIASNMGRSISFSIR